MPLTSVWCSVFKCRSHLMAHFACFVLIKTVDRQCQTATQHYHPPILPFLATLTHTHTHTMKRSWSIIYAISSFTFALGVFRSCSTFLPAHVCALMWLIIKRPAQLAQPSTTLHAVPFPPSPLTPLSARRRVAKKLPSWVATSKARQGHSPLSSTLYFPLASCFLPSLPPASIVVEFLFMLLPFHFAE